MAGTKLGEGWCAQAALSSPCGGTDAGSVDRLSRSDAPRFRVAVGPIWIPIPPVNEIGSEAPAPKPARFERPLLAGNGPGAGAAPDPEQSP